MGDRAYAPASKPVPVRATNGGTANGGGGPPRPAPPSMLPGGRVPPPPMYRPNKPAQARPAPRRRPRRSARGWCCACCLWLTLVLVGLAFLCAVAAGALYVVYRPRPPTFAVTSLRVAALNVSDSDALTSRVEFTVTARNPNEKLAFAYGDISASFATPDGADLGDGVVPGFLHAPGNTTVIRATASASAETVDPVQAAALRSKRSHVVAAEMDARVGVQIGRFRSKRIGVRVTCAGVAAGLAKPAEPAASAPAPDAVVVAAAPAPARRGRGRSPRSVVRASTSSSSSSSGGGGGGGGGKMTPTDAKCKVRIKIWIWSF